MNRGDRLFVGSPENIFIVIKAALAVARLNSGEAVTIYHKNDWRASVQGTVLRIKRRAAVREVELAPLLERSERTLTITPTLEIPPVVDNIFREQTSEWIRLVEAEQKVRESLASDKELAGFVGAVNGSSLPRSTKAIYQLGSLQTLLVTSVVTAISSKRELHSALARIGEPGGGGSGTRKFKSRRRR